MVARRPPTEGLVLNDPHVMTCCSGSSALPRCITHRLVSGGPGPVPQRPCLFLASSLTLEGELLPAVSAAPWRVSCAGLAVAHGPYRAVAHIAVALLAVAHGPYRKGLIISPRAHSRTVLVCQRNSNGLSKRSRISVRC